MIPAFGARAHQVERAVQQKKIRIYTDRDKHDRKNLEAALVITADPVSFPAESLAARWAVKVIARLGIQATPHAEAA